MAFDLGSLVTRMVVEGGALFARDITAGGAALAGAAAKGDLLGLSLGTMTSQSLRLTDSIGLVGSEWVNASKKSEESFNRIGTGLGIAGLAVGAMVGLAIVKFTEYDAALSRSSVVTSAYGEELDKVRQATLNLGLSTYYGATQAVEGVTELGKAGIATTDILGGGLRGALNLAAAGEETVGDAAETAAAAMVQFNLTGKDIPHVADLLAAAAAKSLGSVHDLQLGMKQSGLVASQFDLSIEDTVGTLAAFASAGLIGSDAGTSFKQMLLQLATPTAQQTALLKQYNIAAYDQQGNFVGIAKLADELANGPLKNAEKAQRDYALGVIFGSDAIRAANVLYNEGASGIQGWIDKVNDAGYAAKVAAVNNDNLAGDLKVLGASFDTALIKTGAGANGVLRDLVETTTELIRNFAELPDWMQQLILGGAALTAGTLLLAAATTFGIGQWVKYREAMVIIRAELPLTAAAFSRVAAFLTGPWGIAIAAAVVGLSLLNDWMQSNQASAEQLTATLQQSDSSLQDIYATFTKGKGLFRFDDVNKDLQRTLDLMGEHPDAWSTFFADTALNQVRSTLTEVGKSLGDLARTDLPSAQAAFTKFVEATDGTTESQLKLLAAMPDYRAQLVLAATNAGDYAESMSESQKNTVLLKYAQADATDSSKAAAEAYIDEGKRVEGLKKELDDLLDSLDKANGVQRDAITSNIDYQDTLAQVQDAIDKARDGVDGYALSLDTNTAAGRTNMGMLVDLAKNAWDSATATLAADGNTANFQASLEASRQALIDRAMDFGYTAEQAQALADKILHIPSKAETQAIIDTSQANAALAALNASIANYRASNMNLTAYVRAVGGAANGRFTTRADGDMNAPRMSQQSAQMRAAGSYVVWAEDETEGETFLPHAMSKRARSEAYLAKTAALFGGTYIPAGARGYAEGGMTGQGGPAGKVVNFHQTVINPVVHDLVEETRQGAQLVDSMLGV